MMRLIAVPEYCMGCRLGEIFVLPIITDTKGMYRYPGRIFNSIIQL